jgi:hypothetical protein
VVVRLLGARARLRFVVVVWLMHQVYQLFG